jgi:hypothetical protein
VRAFGREGGCGSHMSSGWVVHVHCVLSRGVLAPLALLPHFPEVHTQLLQSAHRVFLQALTMAAAVANPADFDGSMLKCKKAVFKHRVRVKDFIMDFDKLRSGFVHDNHFLTALSMAKLDKELSPAERDCRALPGRARPQPQHGGLRVLPQGGGHHLRNAGTTQVGTWAWGGDIMVSASNLTDASLLSQTLLLLSALDACSGSYSRELALTRTYDFITPGSVVI